MVILLCRNLNHKVVVPDFGFVIPHMKELHAISSPCIAVYWR
jgi:hypothetical protein